MHKTPKPTPPRARRRRVDTIVGYATKCNGKLTIERESLLESYHTAGKGPPTLTLVKGGK